MKSFLKKFAAALVVLAVLGMFVTSCTQKSSGSAPAASNFPTKEKPITLKIGYDPPPKEITDLTANEFKKMVEERSGGAIKIELYPQNQLGSMMQMFDNLTSGTLEMDLVPWNVLTTAMPEFNAMILPYNIDSIDLYWRVVATDEFKAKLNEIAVKKGIVFLGVPNGVPRGFTSKKAVHVPADIKGMKIRIMDGPIYKDMYNAWGAATSTISFSECYTALQQGVIEALDNTLNMGVLMKFFEVCKYHTETVHIIHGCPMFIGKGFWDKLSPEQQAIMQQAAKEMEVYSEKTYKEVDAGFVTQAKNDFKENVIYLTPDELRQWRDASKPVYDKYRSIIGESFYDWFMKYVDSKR